LVEVAMGAWGVRVAVLVAVLGSVGLAREVGGQEAPPAGTMGVWFPDPVDVGQTGFTLEEFLGGSVAVFADGTLCGRFAFTEPTLVVVGAADQPDACRVEGVLIEFASGRGSMMHVTMEFEADATIEFTNFAPWPPGVVYPDYACDLFEAVGIEAVQCQVLGPPGVAPGGVGNAGLSRSAGEAERSWQVAALVALTIALVAGARHASRRADR
jgi:hypothetical protein